MSSTLIDSVKSAFTDNLLSKVSVLLGETEIDIHNAVHGAIPMVLTDIIHKAHFTEGVTKITNLARLAAASDFSEHFHTLSTNMGGPVAVTPSSKKGTNSASNLLTSPP